MKELLMKEEDSREREKKYREMQEEREEEGGKWLINIWQGEANREQAS